MPQLDMPLEELYAYEGRNPCPSDMDSFWDGSLTEMHRLNAQLVLQPAAVELPGVECFELWFSGMGGARIHAKYMRPKGATKAPAVAIYHGYTGSAGDWFDKLGWIQQGFCVAAMDCRGQGGLSEDIGGIYGNTHHGHIIRGLDAGRPSKLLFRQIFLDAAQLVRVLQSLPEVDATRVAVTGGSQGGALSLVAAALEPTVARCATAYPFLCDYKRVWEMDLAEQAYRELRDYFRRFDPMHEREEAIFNRLGYIDVQHLAHRIKGKVLMATGLMDKICPPSTQFAAFNKITAEKEVRIWPDFGHEGLPTWPDQVSEFFSPLR
jgi:cephalosporin-C deacetylase